MIDVAVELMNLQPPFTATQWYQQGDMVAAYPADQVSQSGQVGIYARQTILNRTSFLFLSGVPIDSITEFGIHQDRELSLDEEDELGNPVILRYRRWNVDGTLFANVNRDEWRSLQQRAYANTSWAEAKSFIIRPLTGEPVTDADLYTSG